MKTEEMKSGIRVIGIVAGQTVTIVATEQAGDMVNVIYRDASERLESRLLNSADIEALVIDAAIRWTFDGDTYTNTNIKFKVKSVDIEGDKAIVNVDVYDVIKRENDREVPTPQNYLRGEIPNITPEKVENRIKIKLRDELKDYIGSRFKYTDETPPETKIDFRFNHIKK